MADSIRVLHVDDEPEFVSLAADFIERADEALTVDTETDPAEARGRLREGEYDAVVSDYDMPETDGLELFRQVREAGLEVPFLLFTGKGSEEIASEALAAGVTDYLQKGPGTDQYSLLANRLRRAVSRHRTEAALAESRRMRSTLISNLPGMVYRCANEPDWPMEFVSDGAKALTGYTPAQLESGEVVWGEDVIVPADKKRIWEAVQDAVDDREPFEVTYQIRTADGETKLLWEQGRGVFEGEELLALEGFITDITEQKENERRLEAREAELREQRDRFSALFENTADCIVHTTHAEGTPRVVDVNPAFERTFGYTREEIVDERLDDFVVPEGRESEADDINSRAMDGEIVEREVRRMTAEGPRDFLLRSVPLRNEREETYAVYTDITERKRTEERFQALIENSADVLTVLDADGTILYESPSIERVLGWEQHELIGENAFDYVHEEDRGMAVEVLQEAVEVPAGDPAVRFRFEAADGSWRVLEAQGSNRLADPAIEGIIVNSRDVTEQAVRHQALERQNERLQEFASVLSHDLRNPLSVAQGRADLLFETGERHHHEELDAALERMDDIIADLLELARRGESVHEVESVELGHTAREAWRTVDTEDGTLEVPVERSIEADPGRLHQLFENLFRNAIEHGGESVTVTVEATDGGFAVTDDGVGIPPEERERVLESGHSGTEDGTGFGLAIVDQIATAHGWTVDVEAGEDGGARFVFRGVGFV